MSEVAVTVDRAWAAARLPRARAPVAARVIVTAGAVLIAATLTLLALIESDGVPRDGRSDAAHVLVRVVSTAPLLALGGLLLAHVPRHPIGWLLGAAGLGGAVGTVAQEYATYSHFVHPLPAGVWVGWVSEWTPAPSTLIPGVALLLFPDGRLVSRGWRPALWCGVAATGLIALNGVLGVGDNLEFQGNPLLRDDTARAVGEPFGIGWFLLFVALGAGIAAIVVRRRAASGETREQLRLLEKAALVMTVGFTACLVGSLAAPDAFDVGAAAALLSITLLAAAMAVAILRHRLYGLDVFIDRALVYSALTLVLGGLYVAAVVGLSRLLGLDVALGAALPATALVAIAVQPVRDRLQRSVARLLHGQRDDPYAAIATLGRRLGGAMAPERVLPVMVETIADALRLPYVAVELADAPGAPAAAHGTPDAGIALRLGLVHAGERIGTLLIGARAHGEVLDDADRRLLEDFAHRASAAASAVALSLEVQRSRERLVAAREEERRRLRADLHDGLGPTLAGAVLSIDAARRVLPTDPQAADALLDRVAAAVEGTVGEVRRLVYGLRPPELDQLGLAGALRQAASAVGAGSPALHCTVTVPDALPALPAAVEVAALRIAQEALTNAARHADARCVVLELTVGVDLRLEVRDDGRGLPADRRAGVGLTSMRERAAELGGTLAIGARDGGGTAVCAVLPLA